MSGNVSEYCSDLITVMEDGDTYTSAVFRGGSWQDTAKYATVGSRQVTSPDDAEDDYDVGSRGFRVAWREP